MDPTRTSTPTSTATPTRTSTPTNTPTVTPTSSTPSFTSASFVYDGDGKRVKSVMNMSAGSTTTYFVGGHYEVTGSTITKYYYAGSQRIALRTNGTLNYLLGDHLGSTSLTTDANGNVIAEMRYKAWGETRYASGTTPTKYQYTGQYSYASDFGLHFYNARWYDSSLSRFAQADTIVVGGVQGLDRYAYVGNSPVRYTDPSGHCRIDAKADDCPKADKSNAPRFTLGIPVGSVTGTQWYGPTNEALFNHENGDENKYDAYSQGWHAGIDFYTSSGTPVYNSANQLGVVREIRHTSHGDAIYVQYGNHVVIYQHIEPQSHNLVADKSILNPRDIIGQVFKWTVTDAYGNQYDNSHVHLEVRYVKESLNSKGEYRRGLGEQLLHNPLQYMNTKTIDYLINNFDTPFPNEFAGDYSELAIDYIDVVLKVGGCVLWNNGCEPGK